LPRAIVIVSDDLR